MHSKKRTSANEEVVSDAISNIRKHIITLQYENEFNKKILEKVENKGTERYIQATEEVNLVDSQIELLIDKLNFYKEKRADLIAKKAIRTMKKYPRDAKIVDGMIMVGNDKLKEIKEN